MTDYSNECLALMKFDLTGGNDIQKVLAIVLFTVNRVPESRDPFVQKLVERKRSHMHELSICNAFKDAADIQREVDLAYSIVAGRTGATPVSARLACTNCERINPLCVFFWLNRPLFELALSTIRTDTTAWKRVRHAASAVAEIAGNTALMFARDIHIPQPPEMTHFCHQIEYADHRSASDVIRELFRSIQP